MKAERTLTPVEAFNRRLLTDENTGDSVLAELEREEIRRLGSSLGGKALLEHFERNIRWSVDQIMATKSSDMERISFLQAFHFFCTEYSAFLTLLPEDEDDG